METTVKVDLAAGPSLDSCTATRLTLPKKRPADTSPLSTKVSISTKLEGESLGASPYLQVTLKPPGEVAEGRPRKRRETAGDDEVREQLIYRILNDSSKKLKKKAEDQAEAKREQLSASKPRLDPPCVKLISKAECTYLVLPSAISIRQLLNCQTPRPQRLIQFCKCGRQGRYRDPGSLRAYCSVPCFRLIKHTSL